MNHAQAQQPQGLGRYRLLRQLHQGERKSVWLASGLGPGGVEQLLALKIMSVDDPADWTLRDEAQALAAIDSTGVCRLWEYGVDQRVHFLARELVRGRPLSALLPLMRERPEAIARVVSSLCETLEAVHGARDEAGQELHLAHGAIDASHVLIANDGSVKLIGLGHHGIGTTRHVPQQADVEAVGTLILNALGIELKLVGHAMYLVEPRGVEGDPLVERLDLLARWALSSRYVDRLLGVRAMGSMAAHG